MDSAQKEGNRHAASFQLNSQVRPSRNRSSPRETVLLECGVQGGRSKFLPTCSLQVI